MPKKCYAVQQKTTNHLVVFSHHYVYITSSFINYSYLYKKRRTLHKSPPPFFMSLFRCLTFCLYKLSHRLSANNRHDVTTHDAIEQYVRKTVASYQSNILVHSANLSFKNISNILPKWKICQTLPVRCKRERRTSQVVEHPNRQLAYCNRIHLLLYESLSNHLGSGYRAL